MITLLNQPWTERLGWTLLHFLWQGILVAALYALARALAGGRISARGRYAIACASLLAMRPRSSRPASMAACRRKYRDPRLLHPSARVVSRSSEIGIPKISKKPRRPEEVIATTRLPFTRSIQPSSKQRTATAAPTAPPR